MRFFSYALYSVAVLLFAASAAHGQLHTAQSGVVRVEADGGSGTGFVVAANDTQFETWTNGHVTGGIGSEARIRVNAGRRDEYTARGVIADRRYSGGYDWAKIIATAEYNGHVFKIRTPGSERDYSTTGGFPRGGRFYSLTLDDRPDKSFAEVTAYDPASIPGQSGSPVVNDEGDVVGVVTLRFRDGRNTHGGFLPIEDWTGDERVHVRSVGKFEVLPNAPITN